MPGTREIDFYTQLYRCMENVHNLILRVRIRKVPSTLMESCKKDYESEERDFHWQERVYSRNEIILYSDPNNCVTLESKRIHEDVKDLDSGSHKWLFSFSQLPSEDYGSMVEKSIFANNFQVKKETWKPHMQTYEEIMRRRAHGRNIVDYCPRKVTDNIASKDDWEQAMYILADLNDSSMSPENIVLLCSIKWNPINKTVKIFPDFRSPNDFETGYLMVLDKHPQFSLEYWIYQVLPENEKVPLSQTIQYPEVAIRDNFIGPSQGYSDFHLFGEIKKAFDFECNRLFINYVIETPNGWTVLNNSDLRGMTVIATQRYGESVFCHLFDVKLTLNLAILENNPGNLKLPEVLLEVKSVDHWGRCRVEGYGTLSLPFNPGCCTIVVPTWKPAPTSVCDKLHYFFTGITPQLADPGYLQTSHSNQNVPYLSRYGFTTVASGKVVFQVNIVHHFQLPSGDIFSNRNTECILQKLNASTLINSVNSVVKAFKEARSKIFNASGDSP